MSPEIKERRRRVAENLKRLRRINNIKTSEKLAEALGMHPAYIRRLESGHAPFGSDMELRFAKFYKVDIEEFYKGPAGSDFEKEVQLLKEEISKYGGIDKIRRLRGMLPYIFQNEKFDENNKVSPARKKKSQKRSA